MIAGMVFLWLASVANAQQMPCGSMEDLMDRINAPACFERLAGPTAYKQFQDKKEIVQDSLWQPRLDAIAQTLNRLAPANSGQRFRIMVLHEPQINAFSVPGGDIYVYEGLLGFILSDEELQGILCHEAMHALHHDTGRSVSALIYLGRAAKTLSRYINQRDNFFDFAAFLGNQKFSREFEEEADLGGSDLCASAGYNPWGMVEMLRHAPATSDEYEVASDHPTNAHRIEALIAHFKAQPAKFGKWTDPGPEAREAHPASGKAAWYESFVDACVEGVTAGRFVLILFHSHGQNTDQVRSALDALRADPTLAAYVVFGEGNVEKERTAWNYANNLHIEKLPSVSLLSIVPDHIYEIERIEGFHTTEDIRSRLQTAMCKASNDRTPGAPPLGAVLRIVCEGQPR